LTERQFERRIISIRTFGLVVEKPNAVQIGLYSILPLVSAAVTPSFLHFKIVAVVPLLIGSQEVVANSTNFGLDTRGCCNDKIFDNEFNNCRGADLYATVPPTVNSDILFTLSDQFCCENEDDPSIGDPAKHRCCGQTTGNTLGARGFLISLDEKDCCGQDNDFGSIPPRTLAVDETEILLAKPSSDSPVRTCVWTNRMRKT
jgi:hypothetical protein